MQLRSSRKRPISDIVDNPQSDATNPSKRRKQSDKEENDDPAPTPKPQPVPESSEDVEEEEKNITTATSTNNNRNKNKQSNVDSDDDADSDLAAENEADQDVEMELASAMKAVSLEPTIATGHRFRSQKLQQPTTIKKRGRPTTAQKNQNIKKALLTKSNKVVSQAKMQDYFFKLKNTQGTQYSEAARKLIVILIARLSYEQTLEVDQAVHQLSQWTGSAHQTLANIWNEWDSHRQIIPTRLPRGPEPNAGIYFSEEMKLDIIDLLGEATIEKGMQITAADIHVLLAEKYEQELPLAYIRAFLKQLDCKWQDKDVYYGLEYDPAIRKERKRCYLQYSHALFLQNSGTHIIVYQDETWINQFTNVRKTWQHDCGKVQDCTVCKRFRKKFGDKSRLGARKKGPRYIISHCITRDGMLIGFDKHGNKIIRLERKTASKFEWDKKIATAELIFQCEATKKDEESDAPKKRQKINTGDYHKQMNAESFEAYLTNRIIPAFESMFPGKKMILFLDNAPTHYSRGEYPTSKAKKGVWVKFMRQHGIKSITVKKKTEKFVFDESMWEEKGVANRAPTKEELQMACFKVLKEKKPDLFINNISKAIRAKGHEVVWNSRYTPPNQPMELWNAYVKRHVKRCAASDRSMVQVYNDILNGIYGGRGGFGNRHHKGVDKTLCEKFINHCHNYMTHSIHELKLTDKRGVIIDNFWTTKSKHKVGDIDYFDPISAKNRKEWGEKFEIIDYEFGDVNHNKNNK